MLDTIHAKKASRAHDLLPSEIEKWIEYSKRSTENTLRTHPRDVRERYKQH